MVKLIKKFIENKIYKMNNSPNSNKNTSLWIGELEHWMNDQYLIEACNDYSK